MGDSGDCGGSTTGPLPSSGLLSSENGGIRQSNVWPSSRSMRNVPHMWPLVAPKLTCDEYWKAGKRGLRMGSWPTTPRPRTVSRVPEREKIRQCRSRSCTLSSPRFSNRMQ